jgi:CBS domain-containing protein
METATVVSPSLPLVDLARELLATDAEALCVVDGDRLVGVVTGMDLVFREKQVHQPTTITFLELVLQVGLAQTRRELEKISATSVGELMTRDVVTVSPETALDELATKMVQGHLSMIPILDDGRLVGVVTRRGMLRAALHHLLP